MWVKQQTYHFGTVDITYKHGDLGGGLWHCFSSWYPKNGELDPTFGNAPPLDAPGHSDKKADRHVCIYILYVCVYMYPDIYPLVN